MLIRLDRLNQFGGEQRHGDGMGLYAHLDRAAAMPALVRFQNMVDGQRCESVTGRWLPSANPYTEKEWAEVPQCGAEDPIAAVEAAHRAFTKGPWIRALFAEVDEERRFAGYRETERYAVEHGYTIPLLQAVTTVAHVRGLDFQAWQNG